MPDQQYVTQPTPTFDPSRHFTLVNGNEYLEVRWRLVWFRSEHPYGQINTELVSHQNGVAVFKATVKTSPEVVANRDTGEVTTVFPGIATGYGMEDAQGFADYLEKAETKAIGRALAALGFGTQFAPDFDFGASTGRVVDAPVGGNPAPVYQPQPQQQYQQGNGYGQQQRPTIQQPNAAATDKQRNLIAAKWRERFPQSDFEASKNTWLSNHMGTDWQNMTRQQASQFIDAFNDPGLTPF